MCHYRKGCGDVIKCNKEVIEISGFSSDIYAEFGSIMQTCYRKYGEEQFNHLVELAKKSDEEIKDEALELINRFSERIKDFMAHFDDEAK